jgi:hypothetical protein
MVKTPHLAFVVCAAVAALATAPSALAGEATGNTGKTGVVKPTPVKSYVMASICAFSGQNPEAFLDPSDPDYEPGRVQSWGAIPKEFRDPAEAPGISCNGHTGALTEPPPAP